MEKLANVLLLAVWFGLLPACSSVVYEDAPTQVLLRLSCDDEALLAQMQSLRIAVSTLEDGQWSEAKPLVLDIAELEWPVEIPVFPRRGSDSSRMFQVVAQALKAGKPLAETRVVANFANGVHQILERDLFSCPTHAAHYICQERPCDGEECLVCGKTGSCDAVGLSTDLAEVPQSDGTGTHDASLPTDGGSGGRRDARVSDASSGATGPTQDAEIESGAPADAGAGPITPLDAGPVRDAGGYVHASDSGPLPCGQVNHPCAQDAAARDAAVFDGSARVSAGFPALPTACPGSLMCSDTLIPGMKTCGAMLGIPPSCSVAADCVAVGLLAASCTSLPVLGEVCIQTCE
ncbi:MAG: hypothetical protein JWN48_4595 [Myxococcaceae bacterium]|nr:hypothetical protein [Myxococcaceae bacterium]